MDFTFLGQYDKRSRQNRFSFCENGGICQKLSIFRCEGILFMVSLLAVRKDFTHFFRKVNIR